MKIVVVIPAYNEASVIASVIAPVVQQGYEVVVVDDGSKDATATIAQQAGALVVRHFLNRGQGAALQTGITYAVHHDADCIVTFDADGQHHADEIDQLVQPLLLGTVDAVLGSRFLRKGNSIPWQRQLLLKTATAFTKLYTGLGVTDAHNGFRALSRVAARQIFIARDGMAHASEIIEQIRKYHLRFIEVGVTIDYTYYSQHKGQKLTNSFNIIWELLLGRITKS